MQETPASHLEDMREIRLSDYFWILFRNKWSFLCIFLLSILGAFLVTDFTTPVYQSETTVRVIDSQQAPSLLSQIPLSGLFGSPALGTYTAQLHSRDKVIAPTVRQLRAEGLLEPLPVHRAKSVVWFANLLNIELRQNATEQGEMSLTEWEDFFIKTLIDEQLKVEEALDGNIITVTVKQRTPERAQQLSNKIVATFQQLVETESEEQMRWWEKQKLQALLTGIKQNLNNAEEELFQFQRDYPEITLNAEGNTQAQLILALQLRENELTGQLSGAELRYSAYQEELEKLEENLVSETVTRNPSYSKLKDNLHEYEIERSGLIGKYDETHPDIVALDKKIGETKTRLTDEEKQIISTTTAYNPLQQALREKINEAEALIKSLVEQQTELATQIKSHLGQLSTWSNMQMRLFRLKRGVEIYNAQNIALETRMREAEIIAESRTESIKVLDMARAPEEPVAPRMKLNLVLGTLLGGILGFTFAVAKNYFKDTYLRLEEAVRQLESLPAAPSFLGVIPSIKKNRTEHPSLIVHNAPSSTTADAFRVIQAKLPFLNPGDELKTVLVTSSTRGEGKSTIAANLASAIAQNENKVLLIDADMRRPSQHKILPRSPALANPPGASENNSITPEAADETATPSLIPDTQNQTNIQKFRKPGLSEALIRITPQNVDDVFHTTVKPTGISNLHLVSAGTVPPNPVELLNSEMMTQWLELAKSDYDVVVIDSPPVRAVAEPVILASIVDAVIYVFDITKTRRFDMLTGIRQLTEALPRQRIGVLCNMINPKHAKSYGYYSRHTSYSEVADEAGNP